MQILANKSPEERKKMIAAIILGVIAVVSVAYLLIGSSSSTPPKPNNSPRTVAQQILANSNNQKPAVVEKNPLIDPNFIPAVLETRFVAPGSAEIGRNIFGYYTAPKPAPAPSAAPPPAAIPTPSPSNLDLHSISPQMVFARTGEFEMTVSGDKFVNGVQIYINDAQIPTRFVNSRQVTATIPAPIIAGEGQRIVAVKSPDGKLYSNTATLVVQAPPTPNYNFIGIIETHRLVGIAILEDKQTRLQINAQRGDVVGGRFRVTSISPREVVMTDTNLKIKHNLAYSGESAKISPNTGQPRRPASDDDDDAVP
jgi:hypothetical protein